MAREQLQKLTMCKGCGYVACLCDFKKRHADDCPRRKSVLAELPVVACAKHGKFACELCFPCDCGGDS